MTSEPVTNPSLYSSVNLIQPLLKYLEEAGFDPKTILDRAGIDRVVLGGAKTLFPKREFRTLWQVASDATGDPAIALRVSTMIRTDTLGVIGHLALESESRRKAFEFAKSLSPLLWEGFDCELETDGEVAFVRCNIDRDPYASRFTKEYAVGLTVTMSRMLGADGSEPLEARFSYPAPPHAADYERILRVSVRFETGENGVLFPISMMDALNPTADAALRQMLERYAAEQLAKQPAGARFSQRVRACIRTMLPLANPTAETVATEFHMSVRTLRRRLKEEGTSYQELLDEIRAQVARHYLTEEKRGIDEVGFLLGFSDQSAFTKAFRRWTGQTPSEFVRAKSA